MGPALYVGRLRHRRFRPRPHAFTYNLFMVLVDIDQVETQMRASRFTSVNRFNWASFDDRDHLGDPTLPLRARVAADAARHGHVLPDGPVYLLTHLRYLGYNFNPISFYYCCDRAGQVRLVMGEVHSTFGEQCTYWIPALDARRFGGRAAKAMHVSPFMAMDVDYEFAVTAPADSLVAHMTTTRQHETGSEPYFDATLTLERRPWTAAGIRRQLLRHPFMTAKVIAAIHFEALRLWFKGIPHHPHPHRVQGSTSSEQEANT
jgi:DUF1365 family protein